MSPDTEPRPLRIEALIDRPLPATVSIDPEGRYVVYLRVEPNRAKGRVDEHLYRIDTATRQERQLTFGSNPVRAPQIAPDGEHLAFLSSRAANSDPDDDEQEDDDDGMLQLFLLSMAGGEARPWSEAPEGIEAFTWCADGSAVVYLTSAAPSAAVRAAERRREESRDDAVVRESQLPRYELWKLPIDGEAELLIGDRLSIDEFDISPDGRHLVYTTDHTGLARDRHKTEALLRDLESGKERRLTGGRGGHEASPRFSSDGRYLLLHVWNDPGYAYSRQELMAVPVDPAFGEPRLLLSELDRDLEEFEPLGDGRVLAAYAEGMESRLALIDPASGKVDRVPIGGWNLEGLCGATRRPLVGCIVERRDKSPEVALIDLAGGTVQPLSQLGEDLDAAPKARRESVRWNHQQFEHEGLLLLPDGAGPHPLLVWLHGGPQWRVQDTLLVYEAEAFAAAGWAVFMPQFRGSSGYGEAYTLANRGDLGGADAGDILAGLDRALASFPLDPARCAVGGSSYGGYLTLRLLTTSSRFQAGIAMMGMADLTHDWAVSDDESWNLHYLGGPPWDRPELYRERSPLYSIEKLQAPLLLLHGDADGITPLSHSESLFRALQTLGKRAELVVYPREPHGFVEPQHQIDAWQRIYDWLQHQVQSQPRRAWPGEEYRGERFAVTLLGQRVPHDYSGVRPREGRNFFELALQLRALTNSQPIVRVVLSGIDAAIVLTDRNGDRHRAVGVPLETYGQSVLFDGVGFVEGASGEDKRPPILAVSLVFELPSSAAGWCSLAIEGGPVLRIEFDPAEE